MNWNLTVFQKVVIGIIFLIVTCTLIAATSRLNLSTHALIAPGSTGGTKSFQAISTRQEMKRKVILNHSISLEIKEFSVALEALTKLVESSGGYVFKSSRNNHDNNNGWGEVGIRVPLNKTGSVMTAIRSIGRVDSENSVTEDITEGYIDLEARLKNARTSEARLSELFQKAAKVEEILEVEKELTRIRGEIEAFEAKKKNWDLLTEMVTIEVRLSESSSNFPSMFRVWSPIKSAFSEALVGCAESLRNLIIFIGSVLPWLAVFGPLIYVYLRKRRKNKQAACLPDHQ